MSHMKDIHIYHLDLCNWDQKSPPDWSQMNDLVILHSIGVITNS